MLTDLEKTMLDMLVLKNGSKVTAVKIKKLTKKEIEENNRFHDERIRRNQSRRFH